MFSVRAVVSEEIGVVRQQRAVRIACNKVPIAAARGESDGHALSPLIPFGIYYCLHYAVKIIENNRDKSSCCLHKMHTTVYQVAPEQYI